MEFSWNIHGTYVTARARGPRSQSCEVGGDKLLPLRPGQMSAHSALTVHGSELNLSKRRRCSIAVHFVPASVRSITSIQISQDSYYASSRVACSYTKVLNPAAMYARQKSSFVSQPLGGPAGPQPFGVAFCSPVVYGRGRCC